MPIPDFQAIMLPLLRLCQSGSELRIADTRQLLAEEFALTPDELIELLPSGTQSRFNNRVAWAKVYLERAGLVEKTRRGFFKITDQGRTVLANPPQRIDIAYLRQFAGFDEFRSGSTEDETQDKTDEKTPEETLQSAHQTIRDSLAIELISLIKSATPLFFERLVLDLMLKMGYGGSREKAGMLTSLGADEGIDGIINEDQLGLDVIYLQAKRWGTTVGRPEIQRFVGALQGRRAKKGVFLTTSSFSSEAISYASNIDAKVVLIDGLTLAQLMIDFNVGVSRTQVYEIKRVDSDYFSDD